MEKSEIEKRLINLKNRRLKLLISDSEESIKDLDIKIHSAESRLAALNKEESSSKWQKISDERKKKKKYREIATQTINSLDFVVIENKFPGVYSKLLILIKKETNLNWKGSRENGSVTITKQAGGKITLNFSSDDLWCNTRDSVIEFEQKESLKDFLKSIVVKKAKAEEGNRDGDGSVSIDYKPEEIITDIFKSFQETILKLK